MDVSLSKAAGAYASRMREMANTDESADEAGATGGASSFGDLLTQAADAVIQGQHNAEDLKMQSVTGKVDLSDLVTAIANAELTLNTVVAVRDKVITAYQDIIRMPI